MSKIHKEGVGTMRAEYDFSGGTRGKYFERYKVSSNVVVLDPDASWAFPNAESVNDALRVLVAAAGQVTKRPNNRTPHTSVRPPTKARTRR